MLRTPARTASTRRLPNVVPGNRPLRAAPMPVQNADTGDTGFTAIPPQARLRHGDLRGAARTAPAPSPRRVTTSVLLRRTGSHALRWSARRRSATDSCAAGSPALRKSTAEGLQRRSSRAQNPPQTLGSMARGAPRGPAGRHAAVRVVRQALLRNRGERAHDPATTTAPSSITRVYVRRGLGCPGPGRRRTIPRRAVRGQFTDRNPKCSRRVALEMRMPHVHPHRPHKAICLDALQNPPATAAAAQESMEPVGLRSITAQPVAAGSRGRRRASNDPALRPSNQDGGPTPRRAHSATS